VVDKPNEQGVGFLWFHVALKDPVSLLDRAGDFCYLQWIRICSLPTEFTILWGWCFRLLKTVGKLMFGWDQFWKRFRDMIFVIKSCNQVKNNNGWAKK
jgi:hypothetical protein